MENPDVSHDENKKDEAIQQNSSNCIYNKTITNNHNEAEALLKNLHDLSSNDSHLKRKRESEILFSMNEKNLMNKNEAVKISTAFKTCPVCKIEDSNKKHIDCKICKRTFHFECFMKSVKVNIDNQVICNECAQREYTNSFIINNSSNYFNNLNQINPTFNSPTYPNNLNMLNELLKNNINRNFSMTSSNSLNNQQSFNPNNINMMAGSFNNNFQNAMQFNQLNGNKINQTNPQNIPNPLLQRGQFPNIQLSQMSPQQLMILSQMLKNEKSDGQNYLTNSNNNQFINNPIMLNNLLMKQNFTANNINPNQDMFRNNILNQLLNNSNKNKMPPMYFPNQMPTNNFNNNILDSASLNSKNFPNPQQTQNDPQSNIYNLVTKQNNITNLNFFNNLFNISQNQASSPNLISQNQNFLNDNTMKNLLNQKCGLNYTNSNLYQTGLNSKTNNLNPNSSNNFDFAGPNSLLNNLTKHNHIHNTYRDLKKLCVEDSLLIKNPEKYDIDKKTLERPEPRQLDIPLKFQNKIFTIWDFIYTFRKILDPEDQYLSGVKFKTGVEEFFKQIESEEFFNKLVILLISFYVMYSYGSDATEFEFDKGLLLLRTIKENINTNLNEIVKKTWRDILKTIVESKKFNLLVGEEILTIHNRIKEISYSEESDFHLNIHERISILFYLTNSAMDVNKIKDLVKSEFEKKNNLLREKVSLRIEFKNKDLRKKEIEKSERFLKAPQMIEELNNKLEELELNNSIPSKVLLKQKKEIEIERERYSSLLKENIEIQRVKENINERTIKIKNQIKEMNINNKRLIGLDAFKNEYYFFKNAKNSIYVKKLINPQQNEIENSKSKKIYGWFCYDNKDVLHEIHHKLLEKGQRERKLKHKLMKILNKKMVFDIDDEIKIVCEQEDKKQEFSKFNEIILNEKEKVEKFDTLEKPKEIFSNPLDTTSALEIIKKMDEKFSEYLSQFSKEWAGIEIRDKWLEVITSYPTIHNLATSLALFNVRFKNPYRNDEPPLSDQEIKEKDKNKIKFQFLDSNEKTLLVIRAFDNSKLLAAKVKIWSKDLETYDMEKYYTESILPFINNSSKLHLAIFFFESIIFNLIKRREAMSKKNQNLVREITDGNDIIINEIENQELSEDKAKDSEIDKNVNTIINQIPNEDKTVSYSPDNDKTETIVINPSENNSEKKDKNKNDPMEEDMKYINIENKSNLETSSKILIRNKRKFSNINTGITMLKKKKRNATPKDLKMADWCDTCYICLEYGDLVCCDGCTNAAHLFCAYLEVLYLLNLIFRDCLMIGIVKFVVTKRGKIKRIKNKFYYIFRKYNPYYILICKYFL